MGVRAGHAIQIRSGEGETACCRKRDTKTSRSSSSIGSGNAYVNQYAQVIQSSLTDVGLNVQIETLEVNTIRTAARPGAISDVHGNLDRRKSGPDLSTRSVHDRQDPGRRRSHAAIAAGTRINEVDTILEDAVNATDREKAKRLVRQSVGDGQQRTAAASALVSGEHGRREQADRQYQDQRQRRLEFLERHTVAVSLVRRGQGRS